MSRIHELLYQAGCAIYALGRALRFFGETDMERFRFREKYLFNAAGDFIYFFLFLYRFEYCFILDVGERDRAAYTIPPVFKIFHKDILIHECPVIAYMRSSVD
jgi:hypothetical protein